MSCSNSPYHEPEAIVTSSFQPVYQNNAVSPAMANYGDAHFNPGMHDLDAYELGFQHDFYPGGLEDAAVPSFLPNLSYFPTSSEPDVSEVLTPASLHQPPLDSYSPVCSQAHPLTPLCTNPEPPISRPQSSSSALRSGSQWSPDPEQTKANHGLGIREATVQTTPASSPPHGKSNSISSVSDTQTAPPRRYTPIAPNPIGLLQMHSQKRSLSDDGYESPSPAPKKRKRSVSPPLSTDLNEEDAFLLKLKDEEQLSWRDISIRFQEDMGKAFQIPALQMRLKRLRERMRRWTDMDLQALRMAHEFWATNKFDIIAAKMSEFGATEKWSPKNCNRKWQEISLTGDHIYSNHMFRTPTFLPSYTSSPIEAPNQGYYPFAVTSS